MQFWQIIKFIHYTNSRCIQTTVPTRVLLALIIFSITQSNLPVTHPETATTQVSTIAMVHEVEYSNDQSMYVILCMSIVCVCFIKC